MTITMVGVLAALLGAAAVVVTKILAAAVPHLVVRVSILMWPKSHPRRSEILAEYVVVPGSDLAVYSSGVVVAGLVDGLGARIGAIGTHWTLARLLADIGHTAKRERQRRRHPRSRTVMALCSIVASVPIYSKSLTMSAILWASATLMFVPQLAEAALLMLDEIKSLVRRLFAGRRQVIVMLMADYVREIGRYEDDRGSAE